MTDVEMTPAQRAQVIRDAADKWLALTPEFVPLPEIPQAADDPVSKALRALMESYVAPHQLMHAERVAAAVEQHRELMALADRVDRGDE